jgi:hypothetical protein
MRLSDGVGVPVPSKVMRMEFESPVAFTDYCIVLYVKLHI